MFSDDLGGDRLFWWKRDLLSDDLSLNLFDFLLNFLGLRVGLFDGEAGARGMSDSFAGGNLDGEVNRSSFYEWNHSLLHDPSLASVVGSRENLGQVGLNFDGLLLDQFDGLFSVLLKDSPQFSEESLGVIAQQRDEFRDLNGEEFSESGDDGVDAGELGLD